MSNSSLISYTKLSPNNSGTRTHAIDRITPHCVVGQASIESLGNMFASPARDASCNYGIGTDGRIGLIVDESKRSWCSSSQSNDQRAVTIECASDRQAPYAFNDKVWASLVNLCTDICRRNGKKKLLWLGNKETTLAYQPKADEMVLTCHRWFKNKACPGDWMMDREDDLAAEVTRRLNPVTTTPTTTPTTLYRVQVGAYSRKQNAIAFATKVKAAGFSTYIVYIAPYYKVQVGAFGKKENADNYARQLSLKGFNGYVTTQSGTAVAADAEVKPAVKKTTTTVKPAAPTFIVGHKYRTTTDLHVRKTPGGVALTHSQLTKDGQAHDRDKDGCLDEGTVVTCKEYRNGWVRTPSGWVSAGYLKAV